MAFLDAPGIAQAGSEIVVVSATQKQGAQLFDHVGQDRDRFRIWENAKELCIKHRETGVKLSVFPARPESLHGSATAGHAFENLIRTVDYSQIHAACKADPVFQKATRERANPTIRKNPILEKAYRGFAL